MGDLMMLLLFLSLSLLLSSDSLCERCSCSASASPLSHVPSPLSFYTNIHTLPLPFSLCCVMAYVVVSYCSLQ